MALPPPGLRLLILELRGSPGNELRTQHLVASAISVVWYLKGMPQDTREGRCGIRQGAVSRRTWGEVQCLRDPGVYSHRRQPNRVTPPLTSWLG